MLRIDSRSSRSIRRKPQNDSGSFAEKELTVSVGLVPDSLDTRIVFVVGSQVDTVNQSIELLVHEAHLVSMRLMILKVETDLI